MLFPRRPGQRACRKMIVPIGRMNRDLCRDELERQHAHIVKIHQRTGIVVAEFEDEDSVQMVSKTARGFRLEDDLKIRVCSPWTRNEVPSIRPQRVPWGIDYIQARDVEDVGDPIDVAILDTGIDANHPDLRGLVAGGFNAVDPNRSPLDDNGHGTHVAGTIAALDNEFGVVGIKPNTRLYAVKVLDGSGEGYLSDLIEGLEWCIEENILLANMSLSASEGSTAFHEAVRTAYRRGITMVAAAGNSGPDWDTVEYPASYAEVMAVGAVDDRGQVAEFSSRGSQVDILAPGVDVLSTWRGGTYAVKKGTSMAAPHVTGTIALMMAHGTNLSPSVLKRLLIRTASTTPGGAAAGGPGILNAAKAVAAVARR